MGPVVLTGRRRPHEVMVIIWSVAAGVLHFVTSSPPTALDLILPGWAVAAWYVLLGVGGVVGLAGLLWREVVVGAVLERAAMVALAAPTAVYALSTFYIGGWRAIVAGGLIGCWSAACVWQAAQISADLRNITRSAR